MRRAGLARAWVKRQPQRLGVVALALVSLTQLGCTPEPEVPQRLLPAPGQVPAARPVCGWEEANPDSLVHINAATTAVPMASVLALAVAPELRYGDVLTALAPARHTLVRVKLAVAGRWLVPLTVPPRFVERPDPKDAVVTVVGRRQITRRKAAPRVRVAALRLDHERVQAYVEHENPGGSDMLIDQLRGFLVGVSPPIAAFTLTATPTTSWHQVQAAAVAAACYDRSPGEEPREVIFD